MSDDARTRAAILRLRPCTVGDEHICNSVGTLLHHSPLTEPFPDGTTEHDVGECGTCAEWDAATQNSSHGDIGATRQFLGSIGDAR